MSVTEAGCQDKCGLSMWASYVGSQQNKEPALHNYAQTLTAYVKVWAGFDYVSNPVEVVMTHLF